MKKFKFASFIILLFPCVVGCDNASLDKDNIAKITFVEDGYASPMTHCIDFSSMSYSRVETNSRQDHIYSSLNTSFNADDAEEFLKKFVKCGLTKLQKCYGNSANHCNWSLKIEFKDSTSFNSAGNGVAYSISDLDNKTKDIFSKLGTCCNDFLGDYIFYRRGFKIQRYKFEYMPSIFNVSNTSKGEDYNDVYFPIEEGDFCWNGKSRIDSDLCALNSKHRVTNFTTTGKYYLYVSTSDSIYTDGTPNLSEYVVKSYYPDADPATKTEVLRCKRSSDVSSNEFECFFIHEKILLEKDKIYTIDYIFDSGDYYQYTFNTFTNNRKILTGKYVPTETNDFGYLTLFEDGNFNYHIYKGTCFSEIQLNESMKFVENISKVIEEDIDYEGKYRIEDNNVLYLDMGELGTVVYNIFYGHIEGDRSKSTQKVQTDGSNFYICQNDSMLSCTLWHCCDVVL